MTAMNDELAWALSFAAGAFLAVFYDLGLIWTEAHALESKRPAMVFASSILIRAAFVMTVFGLLAIEHLDRLLLCLLGFIVMRLIGKRSRPEQRMEIVDIAEFITVNP